MSISSVEYQKQYRLKNKEKLSAYFKKRYEENKEEIKARCRINWINSDKERYRELKRARYAKNPEHYREVLKAWRETPKGAESYRLSTRVHNVRRHSLTKDLKRETVQRVYEDNIKKYGTLTCYLCEQPIQFGNDHIDHKIPVSRGGSNNYENLGVTHSVCNQRKNAKTVDEFMGSKQ